MNDRQGTYWRNGSLTIDGTNARSMVERAIAKRVLTPYTGPSIDEIKIKNQKARAAKRAKADAEWDEKRARQLAD